MINFKEIVKNQLGYELTDYQFEQFNTYYKFLIEYNKKVNLTRITELEDVYIKHFLDSILVINLIDFTSIKSVIDMGSGAGFPGIPLKILYPHLEVLLVDARRKKLTFIDQLIDKLELSNTKTLHARLEKIKLDNKFDLATARALTDLTQITDYAYPLINQNGYIISYKSLSYEEELKEFNKKWSKKVAIEKVDEQILPYNAGSRYNILLKKKLED